jgi:hypothetical protein
MQQVQNAVPGTIQELVGSINFDLSGSNKYRRFQKMYSEDRIAFVHDIMPDVGLTITSYQEEILGYYDDGYTRVAIRGPHGLGKTFLAAILVHHMVLTSEEDAKVPTTASAWRQLEKYLWPEINKLAKLIAWHEVGRTSYDPRSEFLQLAIKIKDRDVEAFALASDDHTSLEGAHATRILFVFDEAKTIPAATWDAVEGAFSTEGLSDAYKALAFAISTPGDPSGRFYDIHTGAPGYDDWLVRHVTIDEAIAAGRISQQWVDQREVQWGRDNPVFQNRVLGEFADNTEDGLIPLSWVNAAIERGKAYATISKPYGTHALTTIGGAYSSSEGIHNQHTPRTVPRTGGGIQSTVPQTPMVQGNGSRTVVGTGEGIQGSVEGAVRVLGVDVARMGRDSTVIAERQALILKNISQYRKSPTTVTAGRVKNIARGHVINIEMDGLGAGVYDMLREQGVPNLRAVHPQGKTVYRDSSGELSFLNVRAAMWWKMRELLDPANNMGIILPDHNGMKADLIAPRWMTTSTGLIKIEPKVDLKKRLGRSPDIGDAVCLCFWGTRSGGGVVF